MQGPASQLSGRWNLDLNAGRLCIINTPSKPELVWLYPEWSLSGHCLLWGLRLASEETSTWGVCSAWARSQVMPWLCLLCTASLAGFVRAPGSTLLPPCDRPALEQQGYYYYYWFCLDFLDFFFSPHVKFLSPDSAICFLHFILVAPAEAAWLREACECVLR